MKRGTHPMILRRSVAFIFLLCLWTASAWAAGIGEVTRLVGEADVTRGIAPAQSLEMGAAIQARDILRTKKDALLEVTMVDGSRLTLGATSRLEMANYVTDAQPNALLRLSRGRLRSFVTDLFSSRSESFQVRTPTAVVGVQGTEFDLVGEALLTRLWVFTGIVVTYNIDPKIPDRQILRAGQSTVIRAKQTPNPPTNFSVSGTSAVTVGSGGQADLNSSGNQGANPLGLTSTVSTSVPTPPIPHPPGR